MKSFLRIKHVTDMLADRNRNLHQTKRDKKSYKKMADIELI